MERGLGEEKAEAGRGGRWRSGPRHKWWGSDKSNSCRAAGMSDESHNLRQSCCFLEDQQGLQGYPLKHASSSLIQQTHQQKYPQPKGWSKLFHTHDSVSRKRNVAIVLPGYFLNSLKKVKTLGFVSQANIRQTLVTCRRLWIEGTEEKWMQIWPLLIQSLEAD